MKKYNRLRQTNKKRQLKSSKIGLLTFAALFFLITVFNMLAQGDQISDFEIITVQKGDSLWSIAQKYNHDQKDIRKLIFQIRRLNNLEQALIFEGQKIKIPLN